MDEQYKKELIWLAESPLKKRIKTLQTKTEQLQAEVDRLTGILDEVRLTDVWHAEEEYFKQVDAATMAELKAITPPNDELLKSAEKYPATQEWYDEETEGGDLI